MSEQHRYWKIRQHPGNVQAVPPRFIRFRLDALAGEGIDVRLGTRSREHDAGIAPHRLAQRQPLGAVEQARAQARRDRDELLILVTTGKAW